MNIKYTLLGFLLLFMIWSLSVYFELLGLTLLAPPSEVFHSIILALSDNAQKGEKVFEHLIFTLDRTFQGWLLASFIGVIVGLVVSINRKIELTFEPIFEFFRSIPPILAFPLFLVAFNYRNDAYIWTIFFGSLPIMILTITKNIKLISKEKIQILKIYKTDNFIYFSSMAMEILPSILLGLRLTFSISLIIAIVTEMVMTPQNGWALGALARDAEMNFDTPLFYASVIAIGTVGFIINVLLKYLESWISGNKNT